MRNFWLLLSVLWLWTCSGGDKASGPQEPPIVINLTSLGGQAQKGPFNNGTAINVAELTNTLSPTGRNFSTAITDNTGRFSVTNVTKRLSMRRHVMHAGLKGNLMHQPNRRQKVALRQCVP